MVIKERREPTYFKFVILRHSQLSRSVCSWKGTEAGLSPVKEAANPCVGKGHGQKEEGQAQLPLASCLVVVLDKP